MGAPAAVAQLAKSFSVAERSIGPPQTKGVGSNDDRNGATVTGDGQLLACGHPVENLGKGGSCPAGGHRGHAVKRTYLYGHVQYLVGSRPCGRRSRTNIEAIRVGDREVGALADQWARVLLVTDQYLAELVGDVGEPSDGAVAKADARSRWIEDDARSRPVRSRRRLPHPRQGPFRSPDSTRAPAAAWVTSRCRG